MKEIDRDNEYNKEFDEKLNKLINELKLINRKYKCEEVDNLNFYEDYNQRCKLKNQVWNIYKNDGLLTYHDDFQNLLNRINSVWVNETYWDKEHKDKFINDIENCFEKFINSLK